MANHLRFTVGFLLLLLPFGCSTPEPPPPSSASSAASADHGITIVCPEGLEATSDPVKLRENTAHKEDNPTIPVLGVRVGEGATLTYAIHPLAADSSLSADEYFESKTMVAVKQAGEVKSPKTTETIHGRKFIMVEFEVVGEDKSSALCRIYQYHQPAKNRILLISAVVIGESQEEEYQTIDSIVASTQLDSSWDN